MADVTDLDRANWGYSRCSACRTRTVQLTIDVRWYSRTGGEYFSYCWQCYWGREFWRTGPIVNCGPMWDGVDLRRKEAGEIADKG